MNSRRISTLFSIARSYRNCDMLRSKIIPPIVKIPCNPSDAKPKSCGWLSTKSKSMINCNELLAVASKNDVNKKFAAHKFEKTRPQWKKSGVSNWEQEICRLGQPVAKEQSLPSVYRYVCMCILVCGGEAFGSLHLRLNLDRTSCRALEMRSMLCSAFLKSFSVGNQCN